MKKIAISSQKALDYTMYMMAGSYFHSAAVKGSRFQEERLGTEYRNLKPEEQDRLEKMCLYYVCKVLSRHIPRAAWSEDVKVRLTRKPGDPCTRILFSGQKFAMELMAQKKGKNVMEVSCRYLVKGKKEKTFRTKVFSHNSGFRKDSQPLHR